MIEQKLSHLCLLDGAKPKVNGDRHINADLTNAQNGDELTSHAAQISHLKSRYQQIGPLD